MKEGIGGKEENKSSNKTKEVKIQNPNARHPILVQSPNVELYFSRKKGYVSRLVG